MVHKYVFHYFPLRGRGEMIRYIFAHANQHYEDKKYTMEEWPKHKSEFVFGQVPVLEVDGKQLCQSVAIARFLAKEFHIAGNAPWEQALCDMYVDGVQDLYPNFIPVARARRIDKDENLVKQNWQKFKEETLKPFLERYEKFVADNKSGFLVGNSITWADLVLGEILDRFDQCFEHGVYEHYKHLAALVKKVHESKGVHAYVTHRPKMNL